MWSEGSGLVRNCKNWNYRVRNRLTEADADLQQMGNNSRNMHTELYATVTLHTILLLIIAELNG